MKRFWKLVPAVVLSAGLSLMATAQPPDGPKGSGERKAPPSQIRGDAKVDPKVEAWVKVLAEKITDPHDEIRDSARAGLVAVGRPALMTLTQIAGGSDGAKVTAARKVIEAIERPPQQPSLMTARAAAGLGTPAKSEGDEPKGTAPGDKPGDKPGDRPRPGPDGRPPNPFEAILKTLDLSEKQEKQATEVLDEYREKMQGIRKQVEEGKLTREETQPKRDEMQKELNKEMKEILGDKFAKFEEAMKTLPRPGRGPNGESRPKPPQE